MKRIVLIAVAVAVVGGVLYYVTRPDSSDSSPPTVSPRNVGVSAQPVRVVPAAQQPIQAWVFAEGTARSVQRQYLTFDRAGRVTFVKASEDGGDLRAGERVAQGEVLARLDPRQYEAEIQSAEAAVAEAQAQLEVAQSDVTQAQTQYELAAAQFNRSEQLFGERAISQSEYEESEAALKNAQAGRIAARVRVQAMQASLAAAGARLAQAELTLDEIEISSPIDGIIAYLNVEEGFYFTQSNIRTTSEAEALQTIPIVVIDPSKYEIAVDVPSYQADLLRVGQQVRIVPGGMSATAAFSQEPNPANGSSAGLVDWQARGIVFSINPAVNPGGRSVQLRIRTTSGADQLKDGMFVACWIEVQQKTEAIVAPFNAFLFEENRPYLFVVEPLAEGPPELGTARQVNVQIGIESLSTREIVGDVQAGDLLVTDGRYRLVDGAPVRIIDLGEVPGPATAPITAAPAD